MAKSVVRSATAILSSGEAKRTPCSWRWTSAKRLAREKVARRSATVCIATPAASARIASAKSPACNRGRSLRSARPATQDRWSPPMYRSARWRQAPVMSARLRCSLAGRVSSVARRRISSTSVLVGWRPRAVANSTTRAFLRSSMAAER